MGYVGCVSGACFASLGHRVIGVEPNPTKKDLINSGRSPIVEKDLDSLIEAGVKEGRFSATDDWKHAILNTDLALVCVGTPSRTNGSIDLAYVRRVCEQIGQALRERDEFFTVVIRSTIVPGSVEEILIPILEQESRKKAGVDFGVCMNPEFLRESTSIYDFHNPPKTVIGEMNPKSGELLASLYAHLPAPLIRTSIRVAEMVKYVDNTFHALKVTFANEIGSFCKELNVDSHEVMNIFCKDTKLNLSPYYLKPGFAFGGSCLPKDLRALTYEARSRDVDLPMLSSVLESNRRQVHRAANRLLEHKGKRIGFLGLSFKAGSDDLRESPVVELVEFAIGKGFRLGIYDQHVSLARLTGANKDYIEKQIPHISSLLRNSAGGLVQDSDVVVVSYKDEEFVKTLTADCSGKTIIDLVRLFPTPPQNGASYEGICW